MRIHHLQLCAFGPFPETERIDFDSLNSAGLFLLSGPTGAGKSTVFDAICFALYGATTRPENTKGLYSDFARPGTAPYVDLEFTVGAYRYRIRRSPEWSKPSKRAKSGWSFQHAQVTFSRCPADHWTGEDESVWEVLSVRHDETGQLVQDVFGLTREQFAQVVMLPQGQFARFLQASSDEREKLLRRLFPVELYASVRDVLKARSDAAAEEVRKLTEESGRGHAEIDALLERLEISRDGIVGTEGDAQLIDMDAAAARLRQAHTHAAQERHRLGTASTDAARRADALERGVEEWTQHDNLLARRHAVEESTPDTENMRRRLEHAERARPVHEAWTRSRQSEGSLARAEAELEGLLTASHKILDEDVTVDAETEQDRLLETQFWSGTDAADDKAYGGLLDRRSARIHDVLGQFDQLEALESERRGPVARREALRDDAATADLRLREIQRMQQQLSQELEGLLKDVKGIPDAAAALAEANRIAEVTRRAVSVREKISRAAVETEKAEETRQATGKRYDDLMSRRFRQAVRVLADDLEEGRPCPVCGGTRHPNPARPDDPGSEPLVSEEVLEQAAAERDEAETKAKETFGEYAQWQRLDEELRAQGASEDLEHAESEAHHAAAVHRELLDKQTRAETVERSLEELGEDRRATEARVHEMQVETGALDSRIRDLDRRLDQVRTTVRDAPDRKAVAEIGERVDRLRENRLAVARRRGHLQASRQNVQALRDALAERLAESGFDHLEAVEEHRLEGSEAERLRGELRRADEERARVDEAWRAAWHQDLLERIRNGEARPDAEALAEARRRSSESASRYEAAVERETLFRDGVRIIEGISEKDQGLRERVGRASEKSRTLKDLADVAAGIGSENQQRMSLTTFVLAAQLEEIAEAASVRLRAMTTGRYSIRHTDASAGRNRKSGLGLEVFDAWTSEARPTTSLSGGETFMASLCLALGLADVVQARAGGIEVDTLFVDEGFGSLDEDTLESVMDAIDGLRENGRVIGLVSHVADMKTRIPEHVRIKRSPSGSSLESKTV